MNEQDELTQRITAALEMKPSIAVPADFFTRLLARLPQRRAMRGLPAMPLRSNYGQRVTLVMLALLLVAMVCAAAIFGRSDAWNLAEDVLLLQFGALTLWFVLSRRRLF